MEQTRSTKSARHPSVASACGGRSRPSRRVKQLNGAYRRYHLTHSSGFSKGLQANLDSLRAADLALRALDPTAAPAVEEETQPSTTAANIESLKRAHAVRVELLCVAPSAYLRLPPSLRLRACRTSCNRSARRARRSVLVGKNRSQLVAPTFCLVNQLSATLERERVAATQALEDAKRTAALDLVSRLIDLSAL